MGVCRAGGLNEARIIQIDRVVISINENGACGSRGFQRRVIEKRYASQTPLKNRSVKAEAVLLP
jgi:hypothetical protein